MIPPNSHSFYHYVKPSLYYQDHPEYFQDDGKGRRAPGLATLFARKATAAEMDRHGGEGLCLSHPEVYAITMKSLREFIARDRARPDHLCRRSIMVWDYWNFCLSISAPTTTPPDMIPPSVIHADLNAFRTNNVMGMYIEAEGGVNVQNFHDLAYFVGYQLLVNPRQPYEPLVATFMKGYYGPAAGAMEAFRKHLEAAQAGEPGSMDYSRQATGRQYPTAAFYAQALRLLSEAERLCPAGSPEKERVWREKVPVYNGLLNLWDKVASTAQGPMPFDKAALIAEYESLRTALITSPTNIRSAERRQEALGLLADEIALLKTNLPVPEQFKDIPRERLRDVIYPSFGLWRSRLVEDDQSPAKKAVVYFVEDPQACSLPLTTGLYDDFMGLRKLPDGQPDFGPMLKIQSAPADEQYHWYRIGRYSLGKSTGVYGSSMFMHHPWSMRVNLHALHTLADGIERGSKDDPNRYDVYLSLKITGPAYVPGSTKPNAIWVDRVILVRPEVE